MFNTRKQPATQKSVATLQLSTSGQFERLLDSDEAAALLGIHKKTLQRMARSGEVPGVQIGDLQRFSCVHSQRLARLKTRQVVSKQPRHHPQLKLCCPKPLVPVSTRGATPFVSTRTRYQFGSLRLKKRRNGSQAWEFRYYVDQLDGGRKRQHVTIGTCERYPTEALARKAVQALLLNLHAEAPRAELKYQALALFSLNTPKKRCRPGIQLASRMSQTSRRIFDRSGPIIPLGPDQADAG